MVAEEDCECACMSYETVDLLTNFDRQVCMCTKEKPGGRRLGVKCDLFGETLVLSPVRVYGSVRFIQRNTDTSVYGSVYSSVTNAQTCQSRLFQDYTHFSSCSLYPTKLRIPTRHPLFCSWGPTFSATWPPRLASGHSSSTRRWSTPRSAGAPSWASRCPG